MEIAKRAATNPEEMGAAAYDYLFFSRLRRARVFLGAERGRCGRRTRGDVRDSKLHTARFYFSRILPRIAYARGGDSGGRFDVARYAGRDFG